MQRVLAAIFVVLALAALATTPIASGFAMQGFACDAGPSPDWLATIVNLRHLFSFGVLAAVGFVWLRDRPLWVPILLLLVITAAVELEEAVFVAGHCRLRDMVPDVLAIALGWLLSLAIIGMMRRNSKV